MFKQDLRGVPIENLIKNENSIGGNFFYFAAKPQAVLPELPPFILVILYLAYNIQLV